MYKMQRLRLNQANRQLDSEIVQTIPEPCLGPYENSLPHTSFHGIDLAENYRQYLKFIALKCIQKV